MRHGRMLDVAIRVGPTRVGLAAGRLARCAAGIAHDNEGARLAYTALGLNVHPRADARLHEPADGR